MLPKYGSKVELCYMDTESFVFKIETRFDTGVSSKDDKKLLLIGKNKKVICMIKDEIGVKIMTDFIALKASMCVYRKIDKKLEDESYKGTTKFVFAESLTFDDYNTYLFNGKKIHRDDMFFQNRKREVYTVNKKKIALNRDDDRH